MATTDGDAHVTEGPWIWEYCDRSERKLMLVLVDSGASTDRQFWLVEGKIPGHVRRVSKRKSFQAPAGASGRDMAVPPAARQLADVRARIHQMDEMGIGIQVMHPTVFIQQVTDKLGCEAPICNDYGRVDMSVEFDALRTFGKRWQGVARTRQEDSRRQSGVLLGNHELDFGASFEPIL